MLDDHALLTAARGGDQQAYAALHRHHHRRAVQEARKVVANNADAEDSVAAAFASTFLAIRKGGGPDKSFRAYLMTAVHNAALQLVRSKHFTSEVATAAPVSSVAHMDVYQVGADPAIREAFQNLPSRWQEVLWKTEVEGRPPRVLTAEMEMSATSIAALAKRARDGFRTAYLTSAVGSDPHPWAVERLDLLREGALDPRTRDLVELHVEGCVHCQGVLAEIPVPISGASLGAILLIGGAVAPLGSIGGVAAGGAVGPWLRLVRTRSLGRMSARVATLSAVSVAVVGTVLVVGISARSEPTARPTSTTAISAPASVGLPPATGGPAGGGAGSPAPVGPVSGGTDPGPGAPGTSASVDGPPAAAVGTSTSTGTVIGDSSSEGVAGGAATATATRASTASGDATPLPAAGSTSTSTSTSARGASPTTVPSSTTTSTPGISVAATTPSTGTAVEPPPGAVTFTPPAGTPVPTVAPTVAPDPALAPVPTSADVPTTSLPTAPSSTAPSSTAPSSTAPSSTAPASVVSSSTAPALTAPALVVSSTAPALVVSSSTAPSLVVPSSIAPSSTAPPSARPAPAPQPTAPPTTVPPATAAATTTTSTAAPPDYRGTVSFLPLGGSSGIASVLAVGNDGLPAGTTLRFTASSIDRSWAVSFSNIRNCPDLPMSLPRGDNVHSLAVQCTTATLPRGGLASVTVNVVDQTCSGTGGGVQVVVVAQRPGGLPSSPLQLTLGCR